MSTEIYQQRCGVYEQTTVTRRIEEGDVTKEREHVSELLSSF